VRVAAEELPQGALAFLGFLRSRYACKRFDPSRLVPPALVDYLIECARLSPSSFGLEHTRVIAVTGEKARGALAEASGGQDPVATAPLILAFIAPRAAAYEPDSGLVRSRTERFPGGHEVFKADYEGYYEFLKREGRLESWARSQAYIAATNAMTGGAAAGLDSCAIEGFSEPEALRALDLDESQWLLSLLTCFGYRAEERRESIRLPAGEMSEYR
jgi:Nitroreductase